MNASRRRFLAFGCSAGLALTAWPLRGDDNDADTSQAKDMITPEAQKAIERGLSYLASSQHHDGGWGERQQYDGNVAVTSLAGLAFMAGGHQPGRGLHGKGVEKALEFVMSKEAKDSNSTPGFLHNPVGSPFGAMYSHGFGTLFLAEAYGMAPKSQQKKLRGTLERAVALILKSQNPDGGWRYDPIPKNADVSVTICQIMALRSARNAGLHVPKEVVDKCIKYVKMCQNRDGGFSYMPHQGISAFARSAAGVCALYSAGVYEGKEVERGLVYLKSKMPNQAFGRREMPDMHYYYGQYYAAQVMWTAGGSYWKEWFPAIREELLSRWRFHNDGAWADATTCNDYATAMACIILQIPNNYLPILQK